MTENHLEKDCRLQANHAKNIYAYHRNLQVNPGSNSVLVDKLFILPHKFLVEYQVN